MMEDKILELLNNDHEYYNGIGKQYLSNSDISSLLGNKRMFKQDSEPNKNFLIGGLFHQLLLEPHKVNDFKFVDCSTRNTKTYKDFLESNNLDMCLLKSEYDETIELSEAMKINMAIFDEIYSNGNEYEVPIIGSINGTMWKGKADIVTPHKLIDLKTTSSIRDFKWSAKKYNYDSQCYIYQTLFNKPLEFIVIDKITKEIGVFEPSPSFISGGEQKVEIAIEVFNKFFGDNPTETIENYIMYDIL